MCSVVSAVIYYLIVKGRRAVKLLAGLFFCHWVLSHPRQVCSFFPAEVPLSALAAAAAVLGVTLSTVLGWLYFGIRGLTHSARIPKGTDTAADTGTILRRLLYVMIPVALGSLVTNLTSLLDLVTMMRCLVRVQMCAPEQLLSRLGDVAAKPDFPAFVYGCFSGMALTIFNLVPSVTNMLGKSALPFASSCWAQKDTAGIRTHCQAVVTAAAAIAFPAAGGLWILAEPVMAVLYGSCPEEAALAVASLRSLLPGMVCLCLTVPLCSILQGMGKVILPVKCMLAGVAVKLIGNLVLIPRPAFCITGAGISTSACYLLLLLLILWNLRRILGQSLGLLRPLFPVFLSAVCCTATAALCRNFFYQAAPLFLTAVCCTAGGCIYLLLLWLFGGKKQCRH